MLYPFRVPQRLASRLLYQSSRLLPLWGFRTSTQRLPYRDYILRLLYQPSRLLYQDARRFRRAKPFMQKTSEGFPSPLMRPTDHGGTRLSGTPLRTWTAYPNLDCPLCESLDGSIPPPCEAGLPDQITHPPAPLAGRVRVTPLRILPPFAYYCCRLVQRFCF